MPVIAVVNRKGGSGKSTLATHLAAYCANSGIPVMLGDVDRQQSTQTWLKLRAAKKRAPILGWALDPKNVLRSPPGISHVILDTPGGLRGLDLARVVMSADAILMPVCNSVFDRASAAECYAELLTLPRVSSGRCIVAAVGMRLDSRTKGGEVLKEWAAERSLPFVGVLRETQAYVKCVEQGLTLFDMPAAQVQADIEQWRPILHWLGPLLLRAPQAVEPLRRPSERAAAPGRPKQGPTLSEGRSPYSASGVPKSPKPQQPVPRNKALAALS
ncbi:MAG TPA: ParA family protein, partial [Albitalea sp.]|nr:ParA family protein [Albitalea sp.]